LPGPRSAIADLAAARIDSTVVEDGPMTFSMALLPE